MHRSGGEEEEGRKRGRRRAWTEHFGSPHTPLTYDETESLPVPEVVLGRAAELTSGGQMDPLHCLFLSPEPA